MVPPDDVMNLIATPVAAGRAITLAWDNPPEDSYSYVEIRYGFYDFSSPPLPTEGYLADKIRNDENPNNYFSHAGLLNGQEYKYAVFTVNAEGTYSTGYAVSAIPKDVLPPAEVQNLVITDTGNGALTLEWENPTDWDFAGVHIRKSTTDFPVDNSDGSAIDTGVGNVCGKGNGCIEWDSVQPESFTDSVTNGDITYYRVYAYDYACNYSLIGETVSGAAPLRPVTELQAMEGVERVYLSWKNVDSQTSKFLLRYNNDPEVEIPTETDGWAVETEAFPATPGEVPATNTAVMNHMDSSGNPLSVDPVEYHYTVFAVSADGIISPGSSISIKLPAGVTNVFFDDFEGADFCTTWDTRDDDNRGYDNCSTTGLYEFWGPINDAGIAYEGNYCAFSAALRNETANDCATAIATGWTGSYRECSDAFMSVNLGDLTGYTRVIITFMYDTYNQHACNGCFEDNCSQRWSESQMYVSMDGGPPDWGVGYFLGGKTYYSSGGWTGWLRETIDLSPYISSETWFAFRWKPRCDGGCGCNDTASGGLRIDNVRVDAY